MKRKVLVIALIMIALASLLVACNKSTNYDGMTKITYELEGGQYMNCELPILQYYDFQEGTSNLIYDPTTLSGESVKREGYKFTGWFKTKSGSGDSTTYSDKWDFESDKVGKDGVTLYAGWEFKVKYTYNVCYVDDNGNKVVLGSYSVKEGEVFDDYMSMFANDRLGYTPYTDTVDEILCKGYYFDPEFTQPVEGVGHPGGESDLAIDVYPKYIKGEYAIVRKASDLTLAKSDNIYLDADIDLGGKTLSFDTYKKVFEGNGHTISNFNLVYNLNNLQPNFENGTSNAVYINLFKELNGATLRNVNFEGVTLEIEGEFSKAQYVYLSPLAMNVVNSTIENVTLKLQYTIKSLPSGDKTVFEIFGDGYRQKDDKSSITNFVGEFAENK